MIFDLQGMCFFQNRRSLQYCWWKNPAITTWHTEQVVTVDSPYQLVSLPDFWTINTITVDIDRSSLGRTRVKSYHSAWFFWGRRKSSSNGRTEGVWTWRVNLRGKRDLFGKVKTWSKARWWQLKYFWNFHPYLGKISNLTNIFRWVETTN